MNLVGAAGYLVGRLHTALVAFLIEQSDQEPRALRAFLAELGVSWPKDGRLSYRYEYAKIDLAIWSGGSPLCAFEVKTDDFESPAWKPTQTSRMAADERLRNFKLFFVTVADSEYAGGPASPAFTHLTLEQWARAARAAQSSALEIQPLLEPYIEEYANELQMRAALSSLRSFSFKTAALPARVVQQGCCEGAQRVTPYMVVLSKLKMAWDATYGSLNGPRLYIHGQGKDTILNFSLVEHKYSEPQGLYFEINRNGRLNAKIATDGTSSQALANIARELFRDNAVRSVRTGSNVTLASFDVGLTRETDEDDPFPGIATRIRSILFRDDQPKELA